MVRIPRAHFVALHAARFAAEMLPGLNPRPLFQASHQAGLAFARSASDRPDWITISPPPEPDKHPWDIAHDHVNGTAPRSAVFKAMGDVYVEPDLLHPGPVLPETPIAPGEGLDTDYPPSGSQAFSPAWHLGGGFCDFVSAWKKTTGKGVRIAHLDTGYWPQHVSTPRNILPRQGWNFYEGGGNTVDPGTSGLMKNPGHGTATLALLAGKDVCLAFDGRQYSGAIGGAPDADVVPVRIAASVVHLYTKPLAQGLDYACAPGDFPPCHVVSLSHGGLPSTVWAEAVNRCYEAGVLIVAASGDSYYAVVTDIATHFTVYPSAFNRVITATGATYEKAAYKTSRAFEMQGCWGPEAVMAKAVAAYTPNVPWMKWGTVNGWSINGAGTSASAPQIAAACALWLSLYGQRFSVPWQRATACREALLNTASEGNVNPTEIGRGILNVEAMLDPVMANRIEAMVKDGTLREAPEDSVSWALWRVLFGIAPPKSAIDEMYETEAAQILARSTNADLINATLTYRTGTRLGAKKRNQLREAFLAEPSLSKTLSARLAPA